jgi:cystinosin
MNITGILLGILISLGSIISYIPQFYNIIKYKSVECISEPSLLLMNLGLMCLSMNSLIFNWKYLITKDVENLLPFITIFISWLMVLIYYILFITYKIKKLEKRIISGLSYLFTYILFSLLIIALALGEKMEHNTSFFTIYANVLGIASAILNAIVYIPQIYTLIKEKDNGNLSLLMYIMQTPGNVIIIIFQAFIYHAYISTWITYLIVLIEQSIILFLMIYFYFHPKSSIYEHTILDAAREDLSH